jgi:cell division septum initiation protein DivIVA
MSDIYPDSRDARPRSADPRDARDSRGTGEHRTLAPYDQPQVERMLRQAIDIVANARTMPMSSSIRLDRDEILSLLTEINDRLPDELRAARWLLKERDEYLARVRREGDELLDMARARAERMVQRTEIAKAAELRARRIVDDADQDARRMKLEAEDYCDQRLARFEAVLDKIRASVTEGRNRLQGAPLQELARSLESPPDADEVDDVFDQDTSEP